MLTQSNIQIFASPSLRFPMQYLSQSLIVCYITDLISSSKARYLTYSRLFYCIFPLSSITIFKLILHEKTSAGWVNIFSKLLSLRKLFFIYSYYISVFVHHFVMKNPYLKIREFISNFAQLLKNPCKKENATNSQFHVNLRSQLLIIHGRELKND